MEGEKGIKETSEMLRLVLCLGSAVGKAIGDGAISIWDLKYLAECLPKVKPAVEGSADIFWELKDLSDFEREQLKKQIEEEFDIPNDQIEQYIESGLKAALAAIDLIKLFGKK